MDKRNQPDYEKNFREFWERVDDIYAHRGEDPDGRFKKGIDPEQFKGQVVLDYGCGGGFWGEQLAPHVEHYIGLDISQKSIDAAEKRLKDFDNVELKRVDALSNFKKQKVNTIFAFWVVSHMPSEPYLQKFLKALEKFDADRIYIQFRHAEKSEFRLTNPAWNILTNAEYLNEVLNYDVEYESEINPTNKSQLVIFRHPDLEVVDDSGSDTVQNNEQPAST